MPANEEKAPELPTVRMPWELAQLTPEQANEDKPVYGLALEVKLAAEDALARGHHAVAEANGTYLPPAARRVVGKATAPSLASLAKQVAKISHAAEKLGAELTKPAEPERTEAASSEDVEIAKAFRDQPPEAKFAAARRDPKVATALSRVHPAVWGGTDNLQALIRRKPGDEGDAELETQARRLRVLRAAERYGREAIAALVAVSDPERLKEAGVDVQRRSKMSDAEKACFIREKGLREFMELPQ